VDTASEYQSIEPLLYMTAMNNKKHDIIGSRI
jgi:hypothetical protein